MTMANTGEMNNMDQEYKADLYCPRNTSEAAVDNSVYKLTGDSIVRNVGNDEISPEDSQSNESTSSSNDHKNNEYQSNSTDEKKIAIRVPLKRKYVVCSTNEEQHSKKSKLEESKAEINASDQEVRQENKEDEISDDNLSGIQDSGDQNEDTCTLKDSVVVETDGCDSKCEDVEVNVANQDEDPSTSTSTATVIKRPEAETLPKLYRLLNDVDILKNGLVAKNPYDWKISVAEHVAYGSGGGQSRYISTCSSLYAAERFRGLKIKKHCRYKYGQKDIAVIDVAMLPEDVKIIDLRDRAEREKHELYKKMEINEQFHKFASSHREVLLVGRVPPECLTLIPFTGTIPDSDESSSDSDYY